MYLARAFLNPISRAVRSDLTDPTHLHRTVMRAFPDDSGPNAREQHGVLHRVDEDQRRGRLVLLVQSKTRPDFTRFPEGYFLDLADDLDLAASNALENPAVRDVGAERNRITVGDSFSFRLQANTTKRISKVDKATGAFTKNGQRVPVRGDEERFKWLARHALAAGFDVHPANVRITEVRGVSHAPRGEPRETARTFAGACFEGHLTVTNLEPFINALANGIGPAKAFGFGLLSIQRAR